MASPRLASSALTLLAIMSGASGSVAQSEMAGLAPLIGTWRSHLDPEYRDHPAIRRFNPGLKGQEMTFEWGVGHEVIHIRILNLDRPAEGDRTPFLDGIIVRNPSNGKVDFLSYNAPDDQFFRGTFIVRSDGAIERVYTAIFPDTDPVDFREVWEWTDENRTSFLWYTDRVTDGGYRRGDIVVRWDRVPRDTTQGS